MALKEKKEDIFFTRFKEYANTLSVMSESFNTFLSEYPNMENGAAVLKDYESQCDSIKHVIVQELNDSFVTPFDREDIYTLSNQLDDLADYMEDIASKFVIYDIKAIPEDALKLGSIIIGVVKQVEHLFKELPHAQKNIRGVYEAVINIGNLEDEGDIVFRDAMAKLFREEQDVRNLLIWKDMYESLEDAIDAGDHLADTVEGILTKNA